MRYNRVIPRYFALQTSIPAIPHLVTLRAFFPVYFVDCVTETQIEPPGRILKHPDAMHLVLDYSQILCPDVTR